MQGKKPTQQAAPLGNQREMPAAISGVPAQISAKLYGRPKKRIPFRPNRFGLLTQQARNHLGYGPKTSGNACETSVSRSTFHLDSPPIIGDLMENTTRPIRVSRIAKEHIAQGSTIV
jgi:hypothetical protein